MESLDSFYSECINSTIEHSKLEFRKIHTRWHCMRRHAETGRAQMIFFEEHKDLLIRKMINQNLGNDLLEISAFLNKCFTESFAACSVPEGLRKNDGVGRFADKGLMWDDRTIERHPTVALLSSGYCFSRGRPEYVFEAPWSDGSLIDDEDDQGSF